MSQIRSLAGLKQRAATVLVGATLFTAGSAFTDVSLTVPGSLNADGQDHNGGVSYAVVADILEIEGVPKQAKLRPLATTLSASALTH